MKIFLFPQNNIFFISTKAIFFYFHKKNIFLVTSEFSKIRIF